MTVGDISTGVFGRRVAADVDLDENKVVDLDVFDRKSRHLGLAFEASGRVIATVEWDDLTPGISNVHKWDKQRTQKKGHGRGVRTATSRRLGMRIVCQRLALI